MGRIVVLELTPFEIRDGRGRLPLRIYASDSGQNTVTLTFFNNPGWAKKQLPYGARKLIVGKLDAWGQELQIVHPEVLDPAKASEVPIHEPVYGLTEGITNKRMRELALAALERAPQLEEWIEPSLLARQGWSRWHRALAEAHGDPLAEARRRPRL